MSPVLASFATVIASNEFKPSVPRLGHILRGLVGDVLSGRGAMIGLGCSIGTLVSGIAALAVSGWVFAAAMFAGASVTTVLGRRTGPLA